MSRWWRHWLFGGLVCISFVFKAGQAPALLGDTEEAFGLDGSLRTTGALIHNDDLMLQRTGGHHTETFFQTLIRLTAGGRPVDRLSYEVHLVESLLHASAGRGQEATPIDFSVPPGRYRTVDATWDWLGQGETEARLWFDRFNLKISFDLADLIIGRQAVTFGKAHFWNPLDLFLPFDPGQFDRDYKAGVDALRIDVPLGYFSGVTLLYVLGGDPGLAFSDALKEETGTATWYGSSVLARIFTNTKGWDFSLQGGKVYGGYHMGGGLVGDIQGLELRGEVTRFWEVDTPPLPPPLEGDLLKDHTTAVIGLGHRFESTLVLELEYLYNGGGQDDDLNTALVRLQNGLLVHLGNHLAGGLVSYDILPILTAQIGVIYSLSDGSVEAQPLLSLSVTDNIDLLVGASLNFGKSPSPDPMLTIRLESEFGTYPDLYFTQIEIYF